MSEEELWPLPQEANESPAPTQPEVQPDAKPVGPATIVGEDPLDAFPSHDENLSS